MDRREAIQKIEAIIDNGQDYGYWTDAQRKALDLAIEALKEKHQLSGETSTCKLKKDHDFLIKPDSDECKEQKSKLDCISRQQAINAVENTDINITESEWDELINAIDNLPPVTPINNIQKADALIIATALRDFAQDSERNISDRQRASKLREPVLVYGASMCKPVTPTVSEDCISREYMLKLPEELKGWMPNDKNHELWQKIKDAPSVTPTERTGEWKAEGDCGITRCGQCGWSIEEYIEWNYCPNCGSRMRGKHNDE